MPTCEIFFFLVVALGSSILIWILSWHMGWLVHQEIPKAVLSDPGLLCVIFQGTNLTLAGACSFPGDGRGHASHTSTFQTTCGHLCLIPPGQAANHQGRELPPHPMEILGSAECGQKVWCTQRWVETNSAYLKRVGKVQWTTTVALVFRLKARRKRSWEVLAQTVRQPGNTLL